MIFNIKRANVESALKLKLVPTALVMPVQKIIDSAPNFDKIMLDVKVYDKDGKEIDVEGKLKSIVLSAMLGVITP